MWCAVSLYVLCGFAAGELARHKPLLAWFLFPLHLLLFRFISLLIREGQKPNRVL